MQVYIPATRGHGHVPINGAMGRVASWWGRGSAGHRVISVVWRGELLWRKRKATTKTREWVKAWKSNFLQQLKPTLQFRVEESNETVWECLDHDAMLLKKSHKKSYVQCRGRNSPAVFLEYNTSGILELNKCGVLVSGSSKSLVTVLYDNLE